LLKWNFNEQITSTVAHSTFVIRSLLKSRSCSKSSSFGFLSASKYGHCVCFVTKRCSLGAPIKVSEARTSLTHLSKQNASFVSTKNDFWFSNVCFKFSMTFCLVSTCERASALASSCCSNCSSNFLFSCSYYFRKFCMLSFSSEKSLPCSSLSYFSFASSSSLRASVAAFLSFSS